MSLVRKLSDVLLRAATRATDDFATAAAFWISSTILRRRVCVQLSHKRVFPNLWFLLVGRSGVFGKTTLLNLARDMVEQVAPSALLPEMQTPEGLLQALAANAQRGLLVDEASITFAFAQRDYGRGYIETLLRLYDSPRSYERTAASKDARAKLSSVYLTALMASTPTMMRPFLLDPRLWTAGLWARLIAIGAHKRDQYLRSQDVTRDLEAICDELRRLDAALQNASPAEPLSAVVSEDALAGFYAFDEEVDAIVRAASDDEIESALLTRAPELAMRAALILATLDWVSVGNATRAPTIGLQHWRDGRAYAERWTACTREALMLVERDATDPLERRIVELLAAAPNQTMRRRDLQRQLGCNAMRLDRAIENLMRAERVKVAEIVNPNGTKTYEITLRAED